MREIEVLGGALEAACAEASPRSAASSSAPLCGCPGAIPELTPRSVTLHRSWLTPTEAKKPVASSA